MKEFIIQLFDMIEVELEVIEKQVLKNVFDISTNPNLIESFNLGNLSFPGISVKYSGLKECDYDIWVRLEMNENLVVGYYSPYAKKMDLDEISVFLESDNIISDRNWIDFDIVKFEEKDLSIDSLVSLVSEIKNDEKLLELLIEEIMYKYRELLK